jgi:hypothetical protein
MRGSSVVELDRHPCYPRKRRKGDADLNLVPFPRPGCAVGELRRYGLTSSRVKCSHCISSTETSTRHVHHIYHYHTLYNPISPYNKGSYFLPRQGARHCSVWLLSKQPLRPDYPSSYTQRASHTVHSAHYGWIHLTPLKINQKSRERATEQCNNPRSHLQVHLHNWGRKAIQG